MFQDVSRHHEIKKSLFASANHPALEFISLSSDGGEEEVLNLYFLNRTKITYRGYCPVLCPL